MAVKNKHEEKSIIFHNQENFLCENAVMEILFSTTLSMYSGITSATRFKIASFKPGQFLFSTRAVFSFYSKFYLKGEDVVTSRLVTKSTSGNLDHIKSLCFSEILNFTTEACSQWIKLQFWVITVVARSIYLQ